MTYAQSTPNLNHSSTSATKLCSKCGPERGPLPITDFAVCTKRADGRQAWCHHCFAAWKKEYRAARRETISSYNHLYRQANYDAIVARQQAYRDQNRELIQERDRTRRIAQHKKLLDQERSYRERHRDELNERAQRAYHANGKGRERYRIRYWLNPERFRAESIKRAGRRREKDAEASRRYYYANRDKVRAYNRANLEKKRLYQLHRRARKLYAEGSHTAQEWLDLCVLYSNKCLCCGRPNVKLTADHIVPLSKGGSDYIDNIQPLCAPCNSSKNARTIDYRPL